MTFLARSRFGHALVKVAALGGLLILPIAASPAFGQLSSENIALLQQRAEEEGWTFTVRENSATNRENVSDCHIRPRIKESVRLLQGHVIPTLRPVGRVSDHASTATLTTAL